MHPPEKTFFQQNIYFSADMKHLPEIVLIDDVTISSPYVHYRRKPEEYILYYIYDGEMYLTEGDTAYVLAKGDILLLDPKRVHYGRKTSTCHYLYLHFRWDDLKEESIQADHLLHFRKSLREQNSLFVLPMQVVTGLSCLNTGRYRNVRMERSGFYSNRCKASFTMEWNTVRR